MHKNKIFSFFIYDFSKISLKKLRKNLPMKTLNITQLVLMGLLTSCHTIFCNNISLNKLKIWIVFSHAPVVSHEKTTINPFKVVLTTLKMNVFFMVLFMYLYVYKVMNISLKINLAFTWRNEVVYIWDEIL